MKKKQMNQKEQRNKTKKKKREWISGRKKEKIAEYGKKKEIKITN